MKDTGSAQIRAVRHNLPDHGPDESGPLLPDAAVSVAVDPPMELQHDAHEIAGAVLPGYALGNIQPAVRDVFRRCEAGGREAAGTASLSRGGVKRGSVPMHRSGVTRPGRRAKGGRIPS